VFDFLTTAVMGAPAVALAASFTWGVLSILLSPCHLASIPLIIGFISEEGLTTTKRAFSLALLFSLGILITIATIGIVTAAVGRMLGDVGEWVNYLVVAIFIAIGLHLLGIIPLPFQGRGSNMKGQKGLTGSLLLGLIFGLALGPCTFAYMAPMIGVTLSVSRTNMPYGILLLATYGIGHCGVIVAAGTSAEAVEKYLQWSADSRGLSIVKKICGVFVILAGLYLLKT
ncbi:MAG: cytochrome c biogenesis CcdA family protein, partial [bacterium]